MKITDFLARDAVLPGVRVGDKTALVKVLAKRAAAALKLPVDAVAAPLLAREALGTTGIGRGVALPHARIANLPRCVGLFARLEKPIDFAAIDGEPVDLIFFLLTPENAGREHMAALQASHACCATAASPDACARPAMPMRFMPASRAREVAAR